MIGIYSIFIISSTLGVGLCLHLLALHVVLLREGSPHFQYVQIDEGEYRVVHVVEQQEVGFGLLFVVLLRGFPFDQLRQVELLRIVSEELLDLLLHFRMVFVLQGLAGREKR